MQFEDKLRINQNAEIWVLHVIFDSIRMLKFKWKGNSQSKCWNLSANVGIYQKLLKFEWKRGDWSNVDILQQKWKAIKMLQFDWKIRNWSEYWNLRTVSGIDQNVEICKMSSQSKCWNLSEKGRLIKMSKFERKGNDQSKCCIWVWMWDLIKILKFECQMSNRSKCWNLREKREIDQMLIFYCKSGNRSKCWSSIEK